MERRISMRQVIRRFLNHLETEKNASLTTIESYRYDLHKFDDYLVKRLGNSFLPQRERAWGQIFTFYIAWRKRERRVAKVKI